jgi:hypothetical protein
MFVHAPSEGFIVQVVLFVSVRNACRTQMAAAWLNALAHPSRAHAMSAGTAPADAIDTEALPAEDRAKISAWIQASLEHGEPATATTAPRSVRGPTCLLDLAGTGRGL